MRYATHLTRARRERLHAALTSKAALLLDLFPASHTLSVLADPSLLDDVAYVSHVINDAAVCASPDQADAYAAASARRANARHTTLADGRHVATVATRHIEAGEELFVTYGARYWLVRHGFFG